MTMLLACTAQAVEIASNTTAMTGFRLDTTELPPSPAHTIFVPPRLAPPKLQPPASPGSIPGFPPKTNAVRSAANGYYQSDELFPCSDWIEKVPAGPEPIRTASPSLEGFSPPRYQPTSVTNVLSRHVDSIGRPAPVRPIDPAQPPFGTGSPRSILGEMEHAYVIDALDGLCGGDGNVAFERRDGQTALTFDIPSSSIVSEGSEIRFRHREPLPGTEVREER